MEAGVAVPSVHSLHDRLSLPVQEVETPALRSGGRIRAPGLTGHQGHHVRVGVVAHFVKAMKEQSAFVVKIGLCFWKTSDEILLTEGINDKYCNIIRSIFF